MGSLVVTKPKKSDTEDGEEEEDPVLIVDPVPVRSGFGGFGGYQPFSAGGGIRLVSAAGPFPRRGGTFGTRSSGSFMVLKSAGPPGPPGAYGRPSYAAAPPPRTTTFQPSLTQMSMDTASVFSADYDADYGLESASYFESSDIAAEELNTQPST